ncbi:MAG: hypothetical protein KDD67_13895 [Ignavibacteriae bacterium]|nr:hypothetical protein [Ignavibacteriota bacterium]MCB9216120.1 hypothetical protein [Ignavibacteria bacterium]
MKWIVILEDTSSGGVEVHLQGWGKQGEKVTSTAYDIALQLFENGQELGARVANVAHIEFLKNDADARRSVSNES